MEQKVLVLFGGKSVEHDISIITARQVLKHLPQQYDFQPVYIDKNDRWWVADNLDDIEIYSDFEKKAIKKFQVTLALGQNILLKKKKNKFVEYLKIQSVLNCCHGGCGENGALSGVFESCDIACTSPNVLSSSLCMDKAIFKYVLKANKIMTPDFVCLRENENVKKLKFPVVVKPCNLGSSIAVKLCKDQAELNSALSLAFKFDSRVLVEKAVENLREFNCACFFYKNQYFLSQVNEVDSTGEIYSFEDKYINPEAKNKEATKTLARKIQQLTEKVYKIFLCSGIVRVDFLYDDKNETLYVNEVNTIPGSLAFYLFKDIPFKELISAMLMQSEIDKSEREKLITSFDSCALENYKKLPQILKK